MTAERTTLAARYRGVVCDLDGVVRRGSAPVRFAVAQLRSLEVPVVFATNNASLTPSEVAAQLLGLDVKVSASDVVTSSQAGAAYLGRLLPAGASVLAIGGPGVAQALREVGLTAAAGEDGSALAVLQGYGPQVTAADLAEAAYLVESGAIWVATNGDTTLPTDRGVAPGNGALVAAVALATGTHPVVVGKPEAALYDLAVARLGCARDDVLAIGDRLDTDILGAAAAGVDSLWVLTGVDDLRSFVRASGRPLPTYAAFDLRALAAPAQRAEKDGAGWQCGGVRVSVDVSSGVTDVTGPGLAFDSSVTLNALVTCAVRALAEARDEREAGLGALDDAASSLTRQLAGRREGVESQ